jgi:hypothetical protein
MLTRVVLLALLLQGAPALRVLESGDQSNMDDGRQAIIRTAAELNTLWRLHAPDRPQPAVNFATEMVIGVFMGSRPSAGFAVQILGVDERGGAIVVLYRETVPARDAVTAQVITSAYQLVAVPRRTGEVRFEKQP